MAKKKTTKSSKITKGTGGLRTQGKPRKWLVAVLVLVVGIAGGLLVWDGMAQRVPIGTKPVFQIQVLRQGRSTGFIYTADRKTKARLVAKSNTTVRYAYRGAAFAGYAKDSPHGVAVWRYSKYRTTIYLSGDHTTFRRQLKQNGFKEQRADFRVLRSNHRSGFPVVRYRKVNNQRDRGVRFRYVLTRAQQQALQKNGWERRAVAFRAFKVPKNDQLTTRYCKNQPVDLFLPTNAGRVPAVIYVHGGGWTGGNRKWLDNDIRQALLNRKIAVVSIDYRLGKDRLSQQLSDVKCSIRWLRANARRLDIDAQRIGLMGHSAGAHLAALGALTATNSSQPPYEKAEYRSYREGVKALVGLAGPYNLSSGNYPAAMRPVINDAAYSNSKKRTFSPYHYARRSAPPTLLVIGTDDHLIPVDQAGNLARQLRSKGATARTIVVTNANHSIVPHKNRSMSPRRPVVVDEIARFVARYLQN